MTAEPVDAEQPEHRQRCYGCYRPETHCFCDLIPRIDNRTEVVILQHTRERFHAFNTARIVHKALNRSRMEVGFTPDLVDRHAVISANTGLLYPGDGATLIDDVEPIDRPQQIVVLDGTWHHAKTMLRDIPWLRDLPRYRIDPASPSQYRIRREPSIESLSTVEATVDYLRASEPATAGLDDLLSAFNTMIDRHISVIGTAQPRHRNRSAGPNRVATNVPRALLGDANDIVIAYGESVPCESNKRSSKVPVVWVAQRLGTEELFRAVVEPPSTVTEDVLKHMEMSDSDFDEAIPMLEFKARWAGFACEADTVFVFSKGTRKLLKTIGLDCERCELLRSIDFGASGVTLAELLNVLGIEPTSPQLPARAGKRLANAVSLVHFVRDSLA